MILGVALVAQEDQKGPRLVFRYPPHRSQYVKDRVITLLSTDPNRAAREHSPLENPNAHFLGSIFRQYETLSDESFAKLFKEKSTTLNKYQSFSIEDIHFSSYSFPSAPNTDDGGRWQFSSFAFIVVSVPATSLQARFPHLSLSCHESLVSLPGEDPIAAALNMRGMRVGSMCAAARKRVTVSFGGALADLEYQPHKKHAGRYVTQQVQTMLLARDLAFSQASDASTRATSPCSDFVVVVDWSTSEAIGSDDTITEPDIDRSQHNPLNQHTSSSSTTSSSNMSSESDVFVVSSLANELRVFFHALTAGRSFNMRLHGGKLFSLPFLCRDSCHETVTFSFRELVSQRSIVCPAKLSAVAPAAPQSSTQHQQQQTAHDLTLSLVSVPQQTVSLSLPSLSTAALSSASDSLSTAPLHFLTVLLLAEPPAVLSTLVALTSAQISSSTSSTTTASSHHMTLPPSTSTSSTTSAERDSAEKSLQNTRLKIFIEGMDPTKSLLDLAMQLDEPVEELLLMTQYLQSLGLAELFPLLHRRSVFCIHPRATLGRNAALTQAFRAAFATSVSSSSAADTSSSSSFPPPPPLSQSPSPSRTYTGIQSQSQSQGQGQSQSLPAATMQQEAAVDAELSVLLAICDGERTLEDVSIALPHLRLHLLEMIIFLLRWHVLCPLGLHFLDSCPMFEAAQTALLPPAAAAAVAAQQASGNVSVSGAGSALGLPAHSSAQTQTITSSQQQQQQAGVVSRPPPLNIMRNNTGSASGQYGRLGPADPHFGDRVAGGATMMQLQLARYLRQEVPPGQVSRRSIAELACKCETVESDVHHAAKKFFPSWSVVKRPLMG